MQKLFNVALLIATTCVASACGSSSASLDPLESNPAVAAVPVREECKAFTWIEVVHRVNGSPVTDRLRLTDEAAADASLALRSFRVAADHFGAANIISSRPVHKVLCFPQQTGITGPIVKHLDPPNATVCVDWNDDHECVELAPSNSYEYPSTETCTVTSHRDSATIACEDSGAIVTKAGDVVLTVNTQTLRNEIVAQTQALRKLVGDANIITNFHFDVVITPDQQAAIVGNSAFNGIAQQIKQASDAGQPLPDVGQILRNLPQPPTNIDFYVQLLKAANTKLERLNLLAHITNGNLLSPQQVNAFYQSFAGNSKLVDKLEVQHTPASLRQSSDIINDTINQQATTDPSSTIYKQVKAGADAMLKTHTTNGVYDPDHVVDFVVPNLHQSLSDADLEKRLAASDVLNQINEALRKPGGKGRAHDMSAPATALEGALKNNDMERAWQLVDTVRATEFFFDHTDPRGTSYDVHLTPEAEAMFNITVQPSSAKAYEVINLLNQTAEFDAATGQVTIDYKAIITINARSALTTDDLYRAIYHTEESWGVLGFLKNAVPVLGGAILAKLGLEAVGVVEVVIGLWTESEAVAAHLKAAMSNWQQTMDIVLRQGADIIHQWPNMTLAEKADLLARIAAEVLATIPPEVIEAGGLGTALEEAVRLHLDKAARGLQIVQAGGVTLPEPSAVELVKQLEHYEITNIDEAVSIGDALDNDLPCEISRTTLNGLWTPRTTPKPPCTPSQVANAFNNFRSHAQQLGFTEHQDIQDLMTSSEPIGRPGRIVDNLLSPSERGFAQDIVDQNGGVLVGNHDSSRKAIDGFFQGHPMQLKSDITSTNIRKITDRVVQTQTKAIQEGFRQVDVYIKTLQFTRDEVVDYARSGALSQITKNDTIRIIDILTADGWVHIENGNVVVR